MAAFPQAAMAVPEAMEDRGVQEAHQAVAAVAAVRPMPEAQEVLVKSPYIGRRVTHGIV